MNKKPSKDTLDALSTPEAGAYGKAMMSEVLKPGDLSRFLIDQPGVEDRPQINDPMGEPMTNEELITQLQWQVDRLMQQCNQLTVVNEHLEEALHVAKEIIKDMRVVVKGQADASKPEERSAVGTFHAEVSFGRQSV